ncbi:MAG: hypothetical protein LAT56_01495 [Wenzhouxiangella sp.]|nr:hypothetical protein [Wenzhouxiangella sp.]
MSILPLPAFSRQRGAALFVAIFLVTVVVLAAGIVTLTTVSQHSGQARAGLADQAWYAALARLESDIPAIAGGGSCPAGGSQLIAGIQTSLTCERVEVREGSANYTIFTLQAQAVVSGTIPIRRSASVQIVGDSP